MMELITNYFYAFLHPFKTHSLLNVTPAYKADIMQQGKLTLAQDAPVNIEEAQNTELTFVDAMSISWLFIVIQGIYSLVSVHIGQQALSYVHGDEEGLLGLIIPNFYSQGKSLIFWTILIQVTFFPIYIWFITRFWSGIIKFFAELFETEGEIDARTNQVVNHSLVSYSFLALPVFGAMAQSLAMLFYLYAGLKNNLRFTHLQSLLILVSPIVFLGFTFVLLAVITLMIFASL